MSLAATFGATPRYTQLVNWVAGQEKDPPAGLDTEPLLVWSVHGAVDLVFFQPTSAPLSALSLGDKTRMAFGCSCSTMAHGPKGGSEYDSPARWSPGEGQNVLDRVAFSGNLRALCGFSTSGYCQPRDAARIQIEAQQGRAPLGAFLYGTIADRSDVVPICVLATPTVLGESLQTAVAAPSPTPAEAGRPVTRWLAYAHSRPTAPRPGEGAPPVEATAPIGLCALSPSCRRTDDTQSLDLPISSGSRDVALANGSADLDRECDALSDAGRDFLVKKDAAFAATTTTCLVLDKYEMSLEGNWTLAARAIRGGVLRSTNHINNAATMQRLWIGWRSGATSSGWTVERWSTETVVTEGDTSGLPSLEDLKSQQKNLGLVDPYYVWVPGQGGKAKLQVTSTEIFPVGPPGSPFSVAERFTPVAMVRQPR